MFFNDKLTLCVIMGRTSVNIRVKSVNNNVRTSWIYTPKYEHLKLFNYGFAPCFFGN